MRTDYIKQVKKNLMGSRKVRKEIIRDLNEIFDSSAENGEPEEQVIQRLGDPADYAEECVTRSGKCITFYTRNKRKILTCCFTILCSIISFLLAFVSYHSKIPNGVIGQADALTEIRITDTFAIHYSFFLIIIGLILAIIASVLIVRIIHKEKERM